MVDNKREKTSMGVYEFEYCVRASNTAEYVQIIRDGARAIERTYMTKAEPGKCPFHPYSCLRMRHIFQETVGKAPVTVSVSPVAYRAYSPLAPST